MSKTIKNSNIAKDFYEIVKSFEFKQRLNLNDIINVFSAETTKILSKIDEDIQVEYILNEDDKTLTPLVTTLSVISDEEALELTNNIDHDARLLMFTTHISLSDARLIQSDCQVDDVVAKELNLEEFSKVLKNTKFPNLLRTIHSSIQQGMSVLRKQRVYEIFKNRIGERVRIQYNAKNSDGSWNVQITEEDAMSTPAYLPSNLVSSKANIKVGQYGHATIINVEEEARLSQVQVSVDSKENVEQALRVSIPELNEGLIDIVNAVRQPGERTKVAFKAGANAPTDFDVFGAIIGPNGQRITGVNEVIGEKIDVILYDDNLRKYIANAMSPARVIDVVEKTNNEQNAVKNSFWVIVAKESLTPAIGRRGVNVSLASSLTNCNLDIISDVEASAQGIIFNNIKSNDVKTFVRRNTRATRRPNAFDVSKINITADSFDDDVMSFTEQEFKDIDTSDFGLEFEELFKQHQQNNEQIVEDKFTLDDAINSFAAENDKVNQIKDDFEDYKRVKEVMENFKTDEDLSKYGLDDFDLSEFDDEDWEE
ncbi:hypothetical protein EG856_00115 [Mycoplasmopsis phocirhinis]|uniref:Uncharacterized protein n=1 Tax=Mycoplasmopsis phocirhinis TaxID=142650 RepID=A0A4P6ML89_9BACT|nr:hypothetical protein [Mycoplasmopsis phocirhinis]QBF34345.1 hypothetical protein EG856_00115 [Mycoplasmopsis phocirhinis]